MIRTRVFSISRKEYFALQLRLVNKTNKSILIGFLGTLVFLPFILLKGNITILAIILSTYYGLYAPLNTIYKIYSMSFSKYNDHWFSKRHMCFDGAFITSVLEDGSVDKEHISHLCIAKETKKYFVLYNSTSTAHFIPKSAFESADDLERFVKDLYQPLHKNGFVEL